MADDKTAPATKADILMLMEEFGKMWQWKGDVDGWRNDVDGKLTDMREDMETWKNEVTNHFNLVAENIRYDFSSANREEIEVLKDGRKAHDKRILALERTAGLAV